MSMEAAAARVGVSVETVRRWVDAHEPTDEHPERRPVALRERDRSGRAVPRSWRRPFEDAVEAWARQRAGGRVDGGEAPARPTGGA